LKKIVCILLLVSVGIGAVFAQEQPAATTAAETSKKNSLTLDLFPLVKGIIASDSDSKISYTNLFVGFERLAAPHFSIGIDFDLMLGKWDSIEVNYIGVSAEGRYYPMSENFEKLFLSWTLGFNTLSIDGKSKPEEGGFSGVTTSLKLGYKVLSAKNFVIEPSMSYVLSKYSALAAYYGMAVPTPLGWQGGLRMGFAF
jgi:hypothetical protein